MFDVTVEQPMLYKALEYLEPTVGKNAHGLNDHCLYMQTTTAGSMEMYTTNSVEYTALELIVGTASTGVSNAPCVDFKRFKTIIGSIPVGCMVKIVANVDDLIISFGTPAKKIKLVGCNGNMIPLPNSNFTVDDNVSIPKDALSQALTKVCAIVSDNETNPIYNCMRIATDDLDIEFTALDIACKRTFVSKAKATGSNKGQVVLLEASKMKRSLKLFEDYNEIVVAMNGNLILVQADDPVAQLSMKTKGMITNIRYYCRRLSGNFPSNIAKNFTPAPQEFMEVSTNEFLNCCRRVKAIEDKTSGGIIHVKTQGEDLNVSMKTTQGFVNEDVITIHNPAVSFDTNFKYTNLTDIVKSFTTTTFQIAVLPSYPMNYVIRATGDLNTMYTVPSMNVTQTSP